MTSEQVVTYPLAQGVRSPEAPDPNIHSPELFAQAYAQRDWRHYRWLVAVCVEHGEPGLIVDLGAGLGFFVEACVRYGLPCVGLEGSEDAIDMAKKRYPMEIRHHYLSRPLPFDGESVAVVVCNQTIEHLTPQIARHLLRESYRVLRRSGLLAIYSPCRYEPTQAAEPTHINLYTPRRLRAEVMEASFRQYKAVDFARPILGKGKVTRAIATLALRLTSWEMLSASANCLAYKT